MIYSVTATRMALFLTTQDVERALEERRGRTRVPRPSMLQRDEVVLSRWTDSQFRLELKFSKAQVIEAVEAMDLPATMACKNGVRFGRAEGFVILLHKLTYAIRLCTISQLHDRCTGAISDIITTMAYCLYAKFGRLLGEFLGRITRAKLVSFMAAIKQKGGEYAMDNCIGFVDGTSIEVARPSTSQDSFYNGHKRKHCFRLNITVTPDGMISHSSQLFPGVRHDFHILEESNLPLILERLRERDRASYVLYGDSGPTLIVVV